MPELVSPTSRVMASFLEAMDEYVAEGARDTQTAGWIEKYSATWHSAEGFAAFVDQLAAEEVDRSRLPERWVLTSTRWYVDGETYLGRIALRQELNDFLADIGGHIGYDVRPSARRRGHATAMLRGMLPLAHGFGIDPALVTCDDDNVGSIRAIEASGGALESLRGDKRRYWVPTAGQSH
ncbi:GNAT family N-acetyltransferase [Nocardioides sp. Root151]|uniref:GNAT family N-acetyltransferase n=1 Tax=Nocardioides sp. Root151 TaxID=1736475 RepID=UPI000703856C|nr:GNAT family N-acetyltransferase [Nocardioides sp. Root151]KQZ66450.1 acetyltransferase [Nocardioides sp. Root151]